MLCIMQRSIFVVKSKLHRPHRPTPLREVGDCSELSVMAGMGMASAALLRLTAKRPSGCQLLGGRVAEARDFSCDFGAQAHAIRRTGEKSPASQGKLDRTPGAQILSNPGGEHPVRGPA